MQCPKCSREIPDDAALCCYCGKVLIRKERKRRNRPRGTGSIRKLNDVRRSKPYRVEKNGRRIADFSTMEAAQLFLDKLNGKKHLADNINLTLDDLHNIWLERSYPELTDKGKATYDTIWPKFEGVKGMLMREIRTDTIQPLIDTEIAKGRSRSQQEKIRSMYSLLCQLAMERDIIDRNYGVDVKRWVFRGGEKTEAGKNRLVPIVSTIRPFVTYFYDRAAGDLFLSGYEGNLEGSNFRKRDYYPTLERLGIRTADRRMTPHSCRYTLATRGHSMGIDDDTLSKILGHAQYDVTSDIYIQADLKKLHKEMSKIDRKQPKNDQFKKLEKRKIPRPIVALGIFCDNPTL